MRGLHSLDAMAAAWLVVLVAMACATAVWLKLDSLAKGEALEAAEMDAIAASDRAVGCIGAAALADCVSNGASAELVELGDVPSLRGRACVQRLVSTGGKKVLSICAR